MIKNYFKIAWRNLRKNTSSSLINVSGLAIGLAVALLIGLWVWDELSFNKYHEHYDSIAQVRARTTDSGTGEVGFDSSLQYPLLNEIKTTYKDNFKYVVMASREADNILSAGDKKLSRTGLYMDADAPEMLTLKMLHGTRTGLTDINSIMLSASTAKAFFGDANPVNKLMRINNKLDVKVTGVYEDLPLNTEFAKLKFISTSALWIADNPWIQKRAINDWDNHFLKIYVQLQPNADFKKVNANIKDAELKKIGDFKDRLSQNPQVFLFQMRDWHLRNTKDNAVDNGPIQVIWLIGIIGAFVLLLACINFMNLSTARSEKRAKEIGIRKAVGSLRRQLIAQFYGESFMVVIISYLLALVIVLFALPWFNDLAVKQINIPWQSAYFWLAGFAVVLVTGLVAGSYPALYLSSFNPLRVLKGAVNVGKSASTPRKVLVVIQFTVSVALIICTVVIYQQVQVAKNRPVGYTREGLIMVKKKSADNKDKYELLRTELKNTGVVAEMSESFGQVTEIASGNGGFSWKGKDPNNEAEFGTLPVSFEFGKTIGWQFVSGRDFSRNLPTDSAGMVINQSAAAVMGLKNPIGEIVSWDFRENPTKYYKIIGVVKDMVMRSPYDPARPTLFMVKGHVTPNTINIKLNAEASISSALPKIESVFKKIIPAVPFEYKFADEDYAAKFEAEERIGKLAAVFAVLAIYISCMGLFGLASFIAEQRVKEIGLRKVLGASIINIWTLMSTDFVKLVLIAQFIASPIANYFMHQWLQKYTYRTEISWWVFALTFAGAMMITVLTVSYQGIRAALTNPVRSLRSE